MSGIETRVLSYEAHRTTLSRILNFNLLKSAGLQRHIHKSRLIMNVKNRYLHYSFPLFTKYCHVPHEGGLLLNGNNLDGVARRLLGIMVMISVKNECLMTE